MTREATQPRPIAGEPSVEERKQSGTRRIVLDDDSEDGRSSSVELVGWPTPPNVDQDSIPTQPATEPPAPPSRPPSRPERASLTLELPPPSYEEVRDTIPAPPPDHAD